MKPSVVIVIIAHKPDPDYYEICSLKQCGAVLGEYPIKLIAPSGMKITAYLDAYPGLEVEYIDPKWQATYAMFNRLKIDPLLYKKYKEFDYLLFYELDAWVFRNELEYWCKQGYDYIGAPWFEGWHAAGANAAFVGVGNGGFSLRKIKSHLKALNSLSYIVPFLDVLRGFKQAAGIAGFKKMFRNLTIHNNTHHFFNNYPGHEDYFWGHIVAGKFKWFRLPDMNTALKFSVELHPETFILSEKDLPFGCHAWSKYNAKFWKQYIHVDPATHTSS
jgi:hypothetical protein